MTRINTCFGRSESSAVTPRGELRRNILVNDPRLRNKRELNPQLLNLRYYYLAASSIHRFVVLVPFGFDKYQSRHQLQVYLATSRRWS